MLLCMKTPGCNKFDGHRSPCEKRVVKITPQLVTITYRKDGKTYLLSIPSEHAEWAEEMLSLDRAEVERNAAERALTDAAEATEEEAPGEPHAGATFVAHAAWLRARAEAYRRERKEQ